MEQFVNIVIRPPRADYSLQDLLEPEFTLKGRRYQRNDLQIVNSQGHTLQCSHYTPQPFLADTALPCVVYCHGNSGCRADGNEAALVLLPLNITVLTLDFSGSGHSDGNYVSLGWNEKDDLKAVVTHLRGMKQISCIGLWGRSMGAVTSLLYGAEDPSIAGMVLDSPFSNLFHLMMELADVYKIRLPKFTVKVALQIMRRIIQKRAHFDIMNLNAVQFAARTFVPALFGHATEDLFIRQHHSDRIFESYAGDKNMIKFEGDHNSPRPQFFYDSLSIFFHNVLSPPPLPDLDDTCYDLFYMPDILQVQEGLNEVIGLQAQQRGFPSSPRAKLLQPEVLPLFVASELQNANGSIDHALITDINDALHSQVETQVNERDMKHPAETSGCLSRGISRDTSVLPSSACVSENVVGKQLHDDHLYPSSYCMSSESWGRCSSNGLSENSTEELSFRPKFSECARHSNDEAEVMTMDANEASLEDVDMEKAKEATAAQKNEPVKKGKMETLSQILGLGCLKGMGSRRKVTP